MNNSTVRKIWANLNPFQKINHFPGSFNITRKDKLTNNIKKMQQLFSKGEFGIIPESYTLPDEFTDFYQAFSEHQSQDKTSNHWIYKPAASSQGKGIYITTSINDIDVDQTGVICQYISNPFLINSHKFDLRIYIIITSFDPLRIYMFKDGLARFASEKYNHENPNNRYSHLTNYSINKKNKKFIHNESEEQDDYGYKWSLSALCRNLELAGIDLDLLWSKIYDLVIKTILSVEDIIFENVKKGCSYRSNCFEILGFDVLIDSNLKPWLLEVNLSPSLSGDSPLDWKIKNTLISSTFNLIGVKKFNRNKEKADFFKSVKGLYARGSSMNSR